MTKTIDARGLSCPQPVLMTLDEIKTGKADEIIVRVDNEASKENVSRAATEQGMGRCKNQRGERRIQFDDQKGLIIDIFDESCFVP